MPTRSRVKITIDATTSVPKLKRPPTHPGEVLLEECLKPAELTQVEAARRMSIPLATPGPTWSDQTRALAPLRV
jgi:antitoxin HigA-1